MDDVIELVPEPWDGLSHPERFPWRPGTVRAAAADPPWAEGEPRLAWAPPDAPPAAAPPR